MNIDKNIFKNHKVILLILLALMGVTILLNMGIGDFSLPYDRAIQTILGNGTSKEKFVLFELRLPRIFITILSGMALALSGAILQGITQNELADPGIIGINSGAGVAVAIFFLFVPIDGGNFSYLIPVVAFIGALFSSIIIYLLAYKKGYGTDPVRLIILGVGFSMALSGLMIVIISSAERSKVEFISKWLSGNVWGIDWVFILAIVPWLAFLIPFTLYKANKLNIINLGRDISIGLGMNLEKERIELLLSAVALSASAVSVTGNISFIGLMSPHIARALVGHRSQKFIPIAIITGGFLLLLADFIGQNLVKPNGLPAGIIVSLIGAPYFIYILMKK
ncbi:MAG: FecCD family ABC transporter permease [Senegalia sp. (in: firmicutes)]|uniref:FecCD family ABC transporter permease n=1 Tax=Senegalia sp. (in: firmicutes) TaxID=1924098 RepID=UPI003F9C14B5